MDILRSVLTPDFYYGRFRARGIPSKVNRPIDFSDRILCVLILRTSCLAAAVTINIVIVHGIHVPYSDYVSLHTQRLQQ